MSESPFDGYDIFSPEFRADPHATWRAMREGGCPVAHSDAWGGSWMPVSYDDIRDIARDGEHFSSRAIEVAGPLKAAGGLYLPPLTSDPPAHKPHRDVLMPYFLPRRIAEFEPFIRERARALAEAAAAQGGGEVVADFAQPLTIAVLTKMLGVPPGEQFTDWMIRMIRIGPKDQAVGLQQRAAGLAPGRRRGAGVALLRPRRQRRRSAWRASTPTPPEQQRSLLTPPPPPPPTTTTLITRIATAIAALTWRPFRRSSGPSSSSPAFPTRPRPGPARSPCASWPRAPPSCVRRHACLPRRPRRRARRPGLRHERGALP